MQIDRLSEVRSRKKHLNPANFIVKSWRKSPIHFEKKATKRDLRIQVKRMTKCQTERAVIELVSKFDSVIEAIASRIDVKRKEINERIRKNKKRISMRKKLSR